MTNKRLSIVNIFLSCLQILSALQFPISGLFFWNRQNNALSTIGFRLNLNVENSVEISPSVHMPIKSTGA